MTELYDCRNSFASALEDVARQNPRIVVLTNDSVSSTKLTHFGELFPERLFNVGIAEQNMIGMASGLANGGKTPFVAAAACFLTARPLEQIKNDIAYTDVNVKLCGVSTGLAYGPLGGTHHSIEDIAWLRAIANMTVIAPADSFETAKAVVAALETEGPVYIRIGRSFEPPLHQDLDFDFEIGRAITLHEGTDLTVIVSGRPAVSALEAAEIAERNKISMRVVDMHTIKPIDEEAVMKAVTETRRIITVEDHNVYGGLGSAVAEVIAKNGKACALRRLGLNDEYSIVGYPDDLLNYYKLDADGILETMQELLKAEIEEDEDWEDEY